MPFFRFFLLISESGNIKHIRSVHERQKFFQCELCNYNYSEKKKLKKHIASDNERKEVIQMQNLQLCLSLHWQSCKP